MALRPRNKHTVDVTQGGSPFDQRIWVDGEDETENTKTFRIWYDEELHRVRCEITKIIFVDKLSVDGVEIETKSVEIEKPGKDDG